jgi:uncharacterized membrane protein YedE/YeeE
MVMIDFTPLTDRFGDAGATAVVGAFIGLCFGLIAQRSRFCARSAVIEAVRGKPSQAVAVWLAALGAGVGLAALAANAGMISLEAIRLRAEPASLSGAIFGGLVFGVGMVLARGCASRQLILAASGNLRAWVTFGVFAIVALATMVGPLAPVRQALGALWMVGPQSNDIAAFAGADRIFVAVLGGVLVVGAVVTSVLHGAGRLAVAGGALIGATIVAAWILTSGLAGHTFDPTPVKSVAFTAPAGSLLSYLADWSSSALSFDIALIPGAFVGALVGAVAFGEFRLQWFASVAAAVRHVGGAALMGFGGVLAIGCTVGALSNAVLMITASWVALLAMAVGGGLTQWVIDTRGEVGVSPVGSTARKMMHEPARAA